MTVIMAGQDTEHIAYWADQVLFMVNGEVVRNGDASLFTRERRLLESSGVQVSDGPSPVIKALPVRNDGKPEAYDHQSGPCDAPLWTGRAMRLPHWMISVWISNRAPSWGLSGATGQARPRSPSI